MSGFSTVGGMAPHYLSDPSVHLGSLTRSMLEYPTAGVSFAYLSAIDKVVHGLDIYGNGLILTRDAFGDKAVIALVVANTAVSMYARLTGYNNYYYNTYNPGGSTQHSLSKMANSSSSVLASGSVSATGKGAVLGISCSGSTIKSLLWTSLGVIDPLNPGTPSYSLTATDTSFASGYYGFLASSTMSPNGLVMDVSAYLMAPFTPLPPAVAVVEADTVGSGSVDDPFRPDVKGVDWGAFEFRHDSPVNIVVVTGGRVDSVKARRVFKPPRSYGDAVSLYNQLKGDYGGWLAGKDSFAYQVLGYEELEPLAVVDFYYGELVEHKTHYDQLKRVPDWELVNVLEMWSDRLERVKANIPPGEYEKHRGKLDELFKRGW